jgi:DNA helicase MCM8
VKPLVVGMFFDCAKCGNRMFKKFVDGRYEQIASCSETKCKNRNLIGDRTSISTIDWQKIKIQEIIGEDDSDLGRIPRTIEVELTNDLVDTCLPGDIVIIAGVLKAVKNEFQSGGASVKDKNQCLFVLYIDANSVISGKSDSDSAQHQSQNKLSSLDFSLRDLHAIRAIYNSEDVFRLIVNSLCPSIFGHELVKAGLCLALFGGVRKQIDEAGHISVRGDPHILIVGDPGLGKSQMLKATSNVSPRGIYVCGNTTSTSGLTVTMVRDGSSGDYSLEAGALVLADQGSCCIDEFDKMTADHQSLLEAMEQQSISIAKGGVVCSLRSRTSVIAAANPIGGHYE